MPNTLAILDAVLPLLVVAGTFALLLWLWERYL